MGKSPFKMPGMAFKEDQAPMKKINFSKLSESIGESKFGETGVGEVLTDVTGVIGKGQDFITSTKDKIGAVGDDDTDVEVEENVEKNIEEDIETPPPPPPPEAPTGKYQGEGKINQPFEFNPFPKKASPAKVPTQTISKPVGAIAMGSSVSSPPPEMKKVYNPIDVSGSSAPTSQIGSDLHQANQGIHGNMGRFRNQPVDDPAAATPFVMKKSPTKIYSKPKGKRTEY